MKTAVKNHVETKQAKKVSKVIFDCSITMPLKTQYSNIKPAMSMEFVLDPDGDVDDQISQCKQEFQDIFAKYCRTFALTGQNLIFNVNNLLEKVYIKHRDENV